MAARLLFLFAVFFGFLLLDKPAFGAAAEEGYRGNPVRFIVGFSTAGAKFDRARALLERLWESGERVLDTQVLEEFYVTVTAKIQKIVLSGSGKALSLPKLPA